MIELGPSITSEPAGLRERLVEAIKTRLLIGADVRLVVYGSLPRDTYKTKLVDYSDADASVVAAAAGS